MKRLVAVLLTAAMVLGLTACGGGQSAAPAAQSEPAAEAESAKEEAPAEESAEAAGAVGDSGKIAVIRLLPNSDHTNQFFAGCVAEGNALGYQVDTFTADNDDVKMQDLMEQALQKDYDIWVISHANEGYQYDMISRAVEKGIKVACFDCGGEHVEGVTYTSQDDTALAKISLDALIEAAKANGAEEPVKFAEINRLGFIVPFDSRHSVIEQYVSEGKLEVVDLVSPGSTDAYTDIYTALSTDLAKMGEGEIHGVWAASSGYLDGAVAAIEDAGRSDIVITAIDISNTEIDRLRNVEAYKCCAAVDPYVIGLVDVRLAVLKTLGVDTPETYALDAVGVTGDQLEADDDMTTLNDNFKDFGDTDAFKTEEIEALRAKFAN